MRRALFLLALLMAVPAAAQDGWQQAMPEKAAPPPPQLRGGDGPSPRPEPATTAPAAAGAPAGWQQATNVAANHSIPPPPQLRSDAPMPTPRPDPQASGPMKLNFPGGITGTYDIAYQTPKDGRPLTLDVYQPPSRNYALPLVVFVHGGNGDSRHAAVFPDLPSTMAGLAAQGYVVASVNYRTPADARFPAPVQDIKAAIRFLRSHAADMNIDATRVALWGVSTGGQLAALAGTSCGVPLFATGADDCVQAVVDWYGPIESAIGPLLGCDSKTCAPGLARTASPLSYINVTSPPFLIEQGMADTLTTPAESQKLQAVLKASNVAADLVQFPEVGHDFTRNGALDVGVTRQALLKMAAFLNSLFPPVAIGAKQRPAGRGPLYQ